MAICCAMGNWHTDFFLYNLLFNPLPFRFVSVIQRLEGGLRMIPLTGNPFQNYMDAFLKDPDFLWNFKEALTTMLYSVPSIIVCFPIHCNLINEAF